MRRIIFSFLFIICFFLFPAPALAKSFYFPNVDIQVKINTDGSADFSEKRTTSFSGNFSQLYWDIPLPVNEQISGVTVNEEVNGTFIPYEEISGEDISRPSGKFFVRRAGDNAHIEVYYSASDEVKTFRVDYKISGVIVQHPDVSEFYWKLIGQGWDTKTDSVNATVLLPGDVGKSNISVWAHGPLNGKVEILDGKTTRLSVLNVPPKTFVEIREIFPKGLVFSRATLLTTAAEIRAEEESFRQQTIFKERMRLGVLIVIILGVSGWIFYWWRVWNQHGREHRVETPKYVHFPPSKRQPALVEALLNQEQAVSVNSFTATILDLARRKFVKIEARESYSKGILGIGSKKEYSYILHRINKGSENKLEEYEIDLLNFVFEMAPDGETVPFDVLKERMKASPATTKKFFDSWKKKIEKLSDQHNFVEDESKKFKRNFVVGNVIIIILVSAGFVAFFQIWGAIIHAVIFPAVFGGIFFNYLGNFLLRWNKNFALEAKQWQGFKNFLVDFSHFKSELPQALIIWEEMLVYGTALGVAAKVSQYLPLILKQTGATSYYPSWYLITNSSGGVVNFSQSLSSGMGLDFSTSITSSMNAMTTAVTSSMSTGSGGGFSGGGGEGGGGGGGGAS